MSGYVIRREAADRSVVLGSECQTRLLFYLQESPMEKNYCRHGNFEGHCYLCTDEQRQRAGALTIERYLLDQEYRALVAEREEKINPKILG